MAVRIRMKMLGRKHRHYFRIVAIDARQPRDGRVIEELGTYDPMIKSTDDRVTLRPKRIKYWLSVGALPSDNVAILFKKYMAKWEEKEAGQAAEVAAAPSSPGAAGEVVGAATAEPAPAAEGTAPPPATT